MQISITTMTSYFFSWLSWRTWRAWLPSVPLRQCTQKMIFGYMNYQFNTLSLSLIEPDNLLYVLCFQGDQATRLNLDPPEKKKQMRTYNILRSQWVNSVTSVVISSSPLLQPLLLHHGPHLHPLDPNTHTNVSWSFCLDYGDNRLQTMTFTEKRLH